MGGQPNIAGENHFVLRPKMPSALNPITNGKNKHIEAILYGSGDKYRFVNSK
jgi:hypothetical protein